MHKYLRSTDPFHYCLCVATLYYITGLPEAISGWSVQLDVGNVLSLMEIDVGGEGANNKRAKRAAKIWTLVFLAVRRRSQHQTHETGILRSGSCKSYACVLRYVPCRILLQQFKTTQISYAYLCLNFGLEW